MTTWEGRTHFRPFGVNAVVNVLETMQVDGSRSKPKSGDDFSLYEADQSIHRGHIIAANATTLEIEMADGRQIKMRKLQKDELGSNISMRGMYSEDWKVAELN